MNVITAISTRALGDSKLALGDDLAAYVLRFLWQCIRLPIFLVLAILEPVASFVLGSLALLGVLGALFWNFLGPPHFPFLLVLGLSFSFELILILYRKFLRSLGS